MLGESALCLALDDLPDTAGHLGDHLFATAAPDEPDVEP